MKPANRAIALILPYAIAALTALAVVTPTGAAEPPMAASAGGDAPSRQAAYAAYAACRDQHQPASAPDAQVRRAQQHHRDPNGRSQRPAWVQQSQGDIERCLRGAPDPALAARTPARYAKR